MGKEAKAREEEQRSSEKNEDQALPGLSDMKPRRKKENRFAVCITTTEPDLEMRKIYQVLLDEGAEKENHLRVIDESGEDYLYPASFFVEVEIPKEAEQALLLAS
jgi:hypothetical protein